MVRDNVLKYKSSLTSIASVTTLQRQVKLASLEYSCKLAIQACKSNDFLFFKAASSNPPFYFKYRYLFEVLGLTLPLIAFQCTLLEYLNMASSQLHQTIGQW